MVDRGHAEQTLAAGDLEPRHLEHDRERLGDIETGDDRQQKMGVGGQGEGGQAGADRQRAGVAHEDLGRRGVEPQEARQAADHGDGDDRQVLGVGHGVDVVRQVGLPEDPEADQGVGEEREDPGPSGEAVEAVGQVRAVGGTQDHQHGPQSPADGAEVDADRADASERDLGADRGEDRHRHGEEHGDGEQPGHLGSLVESEVALARDLQPVVEEADQGGAADRRHHDQAGAGEDAAGQQLGQHVAEERPGDDGEPAHRGGAGLGHVALGTVLADRLSDPTAGEQVDLHPGPEGGDDEGQAGGEEEADHAMAPFSRSCSIATWRSSKGSRTPAVP